MKFSFNKITIVFLFYSLILSYAQNYNDALRLSEIGLGFNARALGMGNSFIGVSDDYSGSFFNPAGLGLMKRMEFSAGINYNNFINNTEFFGSETEFSNSSSNLDAIGFTFPFPTKQGSFVTSFGYNKIKDFNNVVKFDGYNSGNSSMIQELLGYGDISYQLYLTDISGNNTPIEGRLNQSGTIISEGSIDSWSFAAALEIAPRVFAGATLNLLSGSFKRDREYIEDDFLRNNYDLNVITDPASPSTVDFERFLLNDIIEWDLSGWDMKFGLLFNLNRYLNMGFTVKLPSRFTVKENYFVNAESQFGTGFVATLDPEIFNELEYEISTPFVYSGGASFYFAGLLIAADVSYIDYAQMEFSDGLEVSDRSAINKDIKDFFRGVFNYNVGIEYKLPISGLRFRGGAMLKPSPFKDDPTEFDKKFVTAGIGFLTSETVAIDLAYIYGWWKDIGDNYGSGISRTYQDINLSKIAATISYRF